MDDCLLHECFPSEIGKGRVFRGISDADMHDSADARFFSRPDERFTILDRPIKRDLAMRKANPVGVVESGCSLQTLRQLIRIIKVEWVCAHLVAEWILAVRASGESNDSLPYRKKALCYVFAGVTESSSHYAQFGSSHIWLVSSL